MSQQPCLSTHYTINMIAYQDTDDVTLRHIPSIDTDSKEQTQYEGERIMILTGIWTMPGSQYDFNATLHLQSSGNANGTINWHAKRVHGAQQNYSADENVTGLVLTQRVILKGYDTGPTLYPDHYRINLAGDNSSGSFHGTSKTCNLDWSGKMHGTYLFLNQG